MSVPTDSRSWQQTGSVGNRKQNSADIHPIIVVSAAREIPAKYLRERSIEFHVLIKTWTGRQGTVILYTVRVISDYRGCLFWAVR